jgi:hypothetical protein
MLLRSGEFAMIFDPLSHVLTFETLVLPVSVRVLHTNPPAILNLLEIDILSIIFTVKLVFDFHYLFSSFGIMAIRMNYAKSAVMLMISQVACRKVISSALIMLPIPIPPN